MPRFKPDQVIRLTGTAADYAPGSGLGFYFAQVRTGMTVLAFTNLVKNNPAGYGLKPANPTGLLDNYIKNGLIKVV
jgi:hypothetical protein